MKLAILLLAAMAAAAPPTPTSNGSNNLTIDQTFFPEFYHVTTDSNDIVDIVVPLNKLDYYEEDSSEDNTTTRTAAAPPTPTSNGSDNLIIDQTFFPEFYHVATDTNDIVDIVVPLNKLNYDEEDSSEDTTTTRTEEVENQHLNYVFFVTAEFTEGNKVFKGVHVLKNGTTTQLLLGNGQSVTYAKDFKAYFGAKDGIYSYNHVDNTVSKYGSVTDSVIKMEVDTVHGFVYYLTENYKLYKFNKDEVEATKVEAVTDARDFVIDYDGNLFFYDGNKEFFVYANDRVTKIEELPTNPTYVKLIRPFVLINEVYMVFDNALYKISQLRSLGTSEVTSVEFQVRPTAFSPDTIVHQYYAYDKKLYEYNIPDMIENNKIDALRSLFSEKELILELIPYKSKWVPKWVMGRA